MSEAADVTFMLLHDRKALRIAFSDEFTAVFATTGAERLLREIGKNRSLMAPKVSTEPTRTGLDAPENPMWKVRVDRQTGHTFLMIRDPRFGWLSYAFTDEERERLSTALGGPSTNAP